MDAMEERTVLNKAQIDILQLLGHMKTVEQANELRKVICDYYARKVDEEMDRLWDEGKWSQAHIDALATEDVHNYSHYSNFFQQSSMGISFNHTDDFSCLRVPG
jgi:hypothetical protein